MFVEKLYYRKIQGILVRCTYVGNFFKFTFKNYQVVLALLVFLMLIKSLGFEAIEMPQYNAYKHRHINILFSKRNGHVASGIFQRTINNSLFQLQMRRLFIILQQPLTVKNARIKRALLCYNPLSPYQKPYLLALDSGFQRALWAFSLSLSRHPSYYRELSVYAQALYATYANEIERQKAIPSLASLSRCSRLCTRARATIYRGTSSPERAGRAVYI